jgi:hypothetical protein
MEQSMWMLGSEARSDRASYSSINTRLSAVLDADLCLVGTEPLAIDVVNNDKQMRPPLF